MVAGIRAIDEPDEGHVELEITVDCGMTNPRKDRRGEHPWFGQFRQRPQIKTGHTHADTAQGRLPRHPLSSSRPPRLSRSAGVASRWLRQPRPGRHSQGLGRTGQTSGRPWPSVRYGRPEAPGGLRRLTSTAAAAAAQVGLAAAAAPRTLPRPPTWRRSRSQGWRRSSRSA